MGFGLGLLAKGPIIFILTLPPIFMWALISKSFKKIFSTFPIILGILIIAIVAAPWYYLAEEKTPGFIDYFIVGEHFKRFFDSSWSGDKYGFPKQQPLGIIWIFLLLFALPWIQVIIGKLWKNKNHLFSNQWILFLGSWLVWTPLFFTVSKSLIHPYILPVMIPVALLGLHFWKDIKQKSLIIGIALIVPIASILVYAVGLYDQNIENYANSDKYLIQHIDSIKSELYHFNTKSYSSQFYSAGKVKSINSSELQTMSEEEHGFYFLVAKGDAEKMEALLLKNFELIDENQKKRLYLHH